MITSKAKELAINFIAIKEGCKLTSYQDSAGIWTNGCGNTKNVKPFEKITQLEAEKDLITNVDKSCYLLIQKVNTNALAKLDDCQQAALISFVFNVGCGNWRIWNYLNQLKFGLILKELMRFDHARIGGRLIQLKGLTNRREAEVQLWSKV